MLEKIWRTFNTSCLLVLPIYSRILKDNAYKKNKNIKIPFIQLCLELGLIQTYLEDDYILLFDKKKVMSEDLIIDSNSTSFSEIIISCEYFQKMVYVDDEYIAYSLSIPDNYKTDIRFIKNSKYSKVSKEYKSELLITQNKIMNLSNKLSNSITSYNIPYGVVSRSKHIGKSIIDIFTVPGTKAPLKLDKTYEVYPEFNSIRETFNPEKL